MVLVPKVGRLAGEGEAWLDPKIGEELPLMVLVPKTRAEVEEGEEVEAPPNPENEEDEGEEPKVMVEEEN